VIDQAEQIFRFGRSAQLQRASCRCRFSAPLSLRSERNPELLLLFSADSTRPRDAGSHPLLSGISAPTCEQTRPESPDRAFGESELKRPGRASRQLA